MLKVLQKFFKQESPSERLDRLRSNVREAIANNERLIADDPQGSENMTCTIGFRSIVDGKMKLFTAGGTRYEVRDALKAHLQTLEAL